jgi:hypothetical protein
MPWTSLGDAASLAVLSVVQAMEEESRRTRCGRQLSWSDLVGSQGAEEREAA